MTHDFTTTIPFAIIFSNGPYLKWKQLILLSKLPHK